MSTSFLIMGFLVIYAILTVFVTIVMKALGYPFAQISIVTDHMWCFVTTHRLIRVFCICLTIDIIQFIVYTIKEEIREFRRRKYQ